VRSSLLATVLFGFSISACSSSGGSGAPPVVDLDAAVSEAGTGTEDGGLGDDTGSAAFVDSSATTGDDAGPSSTMDGGADSGQGDDASGLSDSALADVESVDAAGDAGSCGSPSGSYTSSCTSCTLTTSGTLICAACKTESGSTIESSIDLCTCPNTMAISNQNGVLTCCGNPGGSYSNTCDECAVTGYVLACTCETDNSGYISSSLDLCTCQSPSVISNTNGILSCGQ
jgi:hypothetical protein